MKTNPDGTVNPIVFDGAIQQNGLTKREHFAAMAMQAVMTGDWELSDWTGSGKSGAEKCADIALRYADALIKRLNEE